MQEKFIDDATQVASIKLKLSLMQDPVRRQKPLNYHKRTMMVLKLEEDFVKQELDRFCEFTNQNGFVIHRRKRYAMQWSSLGPGSLISHHSFQLETPIYLLRNKKQPSLE